MVMFQENVVPMGNSIPTKLKVRMPTIKDSKMLTMETFTQKISTVSNFVRVN